MGIIVDIYRNDYKHPGNAYGDRKQLCITNVSGPFEPSADAPAAILTKGAVKGIAIVTVPTDYARPEGSCGPAFGGTYVATSDSRWRDAIERITGATFHGAVALHDQFWRPL